MHITRWAAAALAILVPCVVNAQCRFEAQRTATESAKGITRVVLVAGAGYLRVRGDSGTTRIEANGRACASTLEFLEEVGLRVHREGATLHIETTTARHAAYSADSYPSLDLTITLPDSIAVDAQDSSGHATFEDLRSLKLLDSSGDLRIRRIAGKLDVTDSAGDIDVDRAGDITLRDSSGDIDISDVKGNAIVDADTSGNITASNIGGGFTVLADSSGRIRHSSVDGAVSIPGYRR